MKWVIIFAYMGSPPHDAQEICQEFMNVVEKARNGSSGKFAQYMEKEK